jgi:hypothetical protein
VLSSGDDTIQGYKDGDEIILSQDLIEKGLSSKQVAVKRTTIDGKGAALLSFELEGQQQTTTVIGVNGAEFEELIYEGTNGDNKFDASEGETKSTISDWSILGY